MQSNSYKATWTFSCGHREVEDDPWIVRVERMYAHRDAIMEWVTLAGRDQQLCLVYVNGEAGTVVATFRDRDSALLVKMAL